jgi:hypothetical protein
MDINSERSSELTLKASFKGFSPSYDNNLERSSKLSHRKGSEASFPYDASKASLALPARASDVDEDLPCCTSSTHRGGSKAHLITLSYDSDSDSDYSEEDSEEDSEDSEGSEDSGDSDESDSDEDVKTNTKMKTKTKANK